MKELLEIMARLRDPETGCPWDRKQTFATIAPYTIEEAYEVADAIERDDMPELRDELGDLLFQVVFYAQMAKEQGEFEFDDVVQAICDKMRRRHPHVFGEVEIGSAEEQRRAWEEHKREEREAKTSGEPPSLLDGVAGALPALIRAEKLQKRAARAGFDWPDPSGVFAKVHEELDEVAEELEQGIGHERLAEEIGDLLFACVNLARHAGVDAETALTVGSRKFERRFRAMEQRLAKEGKRLDEMDMDEMEAQWQQVKSTEG
jgi:MazG family protein